MRHEELAKLLSLTNELSQPNINPLTINTMKINSMALTLKFFGYELARTLAETLPLRDNLSPAYVGLQSKPSTQADISSDWVAYWCSELKVPIIFHRKVWELAYVLQAIYEHGSIRPGANGLGFGCGQEPIPSLLANAGVKITVTDQEPEAMNAQGWSKTDQHATTLEKVHHSHLVTREKFNDNVSLRYVDMNSIDSDLRGYDFCWSICAFEHLGSIQNGLDFIVNSMETLRPGGLSVHTTEFNFANDLETIDNWPTVLFQRRHFTELSERLQNLGHTVAPLNFDVGSMPLDRFIDLPPFAHDFPHNQLNGWIENGPHIKISVDGFASTCFGLVITKAF